MSDTKLPDAGELITTMLADELEFRRELDKTIATVQIPAPPPSSAELIRFARSQEGRAKILDKLADQDTHRLKERFTDPERLLEAVLNVYGAFGTAGFEHLQDLYWQVNDYGGYNQGIGYMPPHYQQNMKRGEVLPVYRTEGELRLIRDRSRILRANNEFALCATQNRSDYVVGDGFKYTAVPKDIKDDYQKKAARKINRILEIWQEVNDMPSVEEEACQRMDEDGEFFYRIFADSDGIHHLRAVEPEHVRAPAGDQFDPVTSFGVKTPADDVQDVEGFYVVENPIEFWEPKLVNQKQIAHRKLNVKMNAKRGLPTFYPIESNLRRCEDLLASMGHIARARAKIALIRKVTGLTTPKATELMNKLVAIKGSDPVTGEDINIERFRYGTILTSGQNVEYEFPGANLGAGDIIEVLQAELRACASRLQMAEWMFTALADAKYSNAFVVEAPTYKAFRRLQRILRGAFGLNRYGASKSLAWRQLQSAVNAGWIDEDELKCVTLQCEGPTLEARDRAGEVTRHKEMVESGFESKHTAQKALELDPTAEKPLIDAEQKGKARPVQDMNAVMAVQQQYTAGAISRPAGVALLMVVMGFCLEDAEKLLPLDMPVNRTQPQPQPQADPNAQDPNADPADALLNQISGEAGGSNEGNTNDGAPQPAKPGGAPNAPAPGQQPNPTTVKEQFDESKIKRDHGEFASKAGAGGQADAGGNGGAGGSAAAATDSGAANTGGHPGKPFAHPKGFVLPGNDARPNEHAPDSSRPELTADEAAAIRDYTDEATYRALNSGLRSGQEPKQKGIWGKLTTAGDPYKVHQGLQSAFKKAPPIKPPVIVKRGITVNNPDAFAQFFNESAKAGRLVTLPGYQSTSAVDLKGKDPIGSAGGYSGNVRFSIHATHGLDAKPYSRAPGENEMILPHASDYAVGRVEKHGSDWHIELFQLHPDAKKAA